MRRAAATTAVLVAAVVGDGSNSPPRGHVDLLTGEAGQGVLARAGFASP
jgi:hypothetical protein